MCDCENMTTSVRDEKIALVFETVFEEHAGDEGEVNPHCNFTVGRFQARSMCVAGQMGSTAGSARHTGKKGWEGKGHEA